MLIFIGKVFDILHEMPSLTSIATASFAFSTLSFTLLSRSAGSCIEKREVGCSAEDRYGWEAQYLYNQELVPFPICRSTMDIFLSDSLFLDCV